MTEDTSAVGVRENLVSKFKTWMTRDASAGGASKNFPTRIEGTINKLQ